MNQIMVANLKDQAQSWYLRPDGSYVRDPAFDRPDAFSAHHLFHDQSVAFGPRPRAEGGYSSKRGRRDSRRLRHLTSAARRGSGRVPLSA